MKGAGTYLKGSVAWLTYGRLTHASGATAYGRELPFVCRLPPSAFPFPLSFLISLRMIDQSAGASMPRRTTPGAMRTTVTSMRSPMRIFSPGFRDNMSIGSPCHKTQNIGDRTPTQAGVAVATIAYRAAGPMSPGGAVVNSQGR